MDVGVGDRAGGVRFAAVDQSGQAMSLEVGCRVREFMPSPDGSWQLPSPFLLALLPEVTGRLDGATVTLQVEVRDAAGRRVTDERTIVARMPPH
jgi:hypothetical protein